MIDWNLHDLVFAIKSVILDLRKFSQEQEIWLRAYTASLANPSPNTMPYAAADRAVIEYEHRFSSPGIITTNKQIEDQNE